MLVGSGSHSYTVTALPVTRERGPRLHTMRTPERRPGGIIATDRCHIEKVRSCLGGSVSCAERRLLYPDDAVHAVQGQRSSRTRAAARRGRPSDNENARQWWSPRSCPCSETVPLMSCHCTLRTSVRGSHNYQSLPTLRTIAISTTASLRQPHAFTSVAKCTRMTA